MDRRNEDQSKILKGEMMRKKKKIRKTENKHKVRCGHDEYVPRQNYC